MARNLRRSILRGHPWIYRDALASTEPQSESAQLAQVIDQKGDSLAWAIYDPHGPLALRILGFGETPPGDSFFAERFTKALALRRSVRSADTDAFRLFNGEGDLLPGLVCDLYGDVAVIQFDGPGPSEFWRRETIVEWLSSSISPAVVVEKLRRGQTKEAAGSLKTLSGSLSQTVIAAIENQVRYKIDLEKGQKTGFFLDQRDNRKFVREQCKGQTVLNLFSYTGGFSVSAGLGGARKVASVDIAQGAIALANENWALNGLLSSAHQGICADVFDFLASDSEKWDCVIVDPPSMGHSEEAKPAAIAKYVSLFSAAAKKTRPGGELSLSSCSSHISFEDFRLIVEEALAASRLRGQVLRFCGQGADHPFPHVCPELRYLKFMHLALG